VLLQAALSCKEQCALKLNATECRSGLSEFHTVGPVGTDTEKARHANVEVSARFQNRWADDDPSCRLDDSPKESSVTMIGSGAIKFSAIIIKRNEPVVVVIGCDVAVAVVSAVFMYITHKCVKRRTIDVKKRFFTFLTFS